jgi:hypothetical protein
MPLVNVKVIEGVFSPSQKADMVKGLTEAMVAIEGENMRPVTGGGRGGQERRLGHRRESADHR